MTELRYRLQAAVNAFGYGPSRAVLHVVIVLALGAVVLGAYAVRRFDGLRDPAAMDAAQIARNLRGGDGFTTRCLRPFDLRVLAEAGRPHWNARRLPELRQGPAYPGLLAAGFKVVRPAAEPELPSGRFPAETRVVVPVGILCTLAASFAVYVLGVALFSPRTGLLGMILTLLGGGMLDSAIAGTAAPLAALLVTAATAAAAQAGLQWRHRRHAVVWCALSALAGLLCGAAFLSLYAAAVLVPVLAFWLRAALDRHGWAAVALFLLAFALVAAPWLIRNRRVSGRWLGLAPHAALQASAEYPGRALERSVDASFHRVRVSWALRQKLKANLSALLHERAYGLAASGIAGMLFVVSLFRRLEEEAAHRLRGLLVAAFLALSGIACLVGPPGPGLLILLYPLLCLFGAEFVFLLAGHVTGAEEETGRWFATIVAAVAAAPVALRLLAPGPGIPYPPYYPPLQRSVAALLEPGELLATDVPEATAWYGERSSLLAPRRPAGLLALASNGVEVAAVYLAGPVADGGSGWAAVRAGRVPPGFPWREATHLPPGTRDQLLLAARVRWPVTEQETP